MIWGLASATTVWQVTFLTHGDAFWFHRIGGMDRVPGTLHLTTGIPAAFRMDFVNSVRVIRGEK